MYLRSTATVLRGAGDAEFEYMAAFPGPLVRGGGGGVQASQDTVAEFATKQAERAATETGSDQENSRGLLWETLALLSRNYGSLMSKDEVTKVHAQFLALLEKYCQKSQAPQQQQQQQSADGKELEQIQRLLVAGKRQDAIKLAIVQHQWAHALVLSQQVSAKAFQDTVAAFAQGTLPEGDPARTLFLLFAQ
jgi:hypothetical protein